MSVVAVKVNKKTIEIASDSFVGLPGLSSQQKIEGVKLFKHDDIIIGSVGNASEISLMKVFCKTHKPEDASVDSFIDFIVEFDTWVKNKKYTEIINSWLFIYQGKAFFLDGDLFVREITDHMAIGAGENFAEAVLYYGKTAREAVAVACHLSPYCEEPITVFKVNR